MSLKKLNRQDVLKLLFLSTDRNLESFMFLLEKFNESSLALLNEMTGGEEATIDLCCKFAVHKVTVGCDPFNNEVFKSLPFDIKWKMATAALEAAVSMDEDAS